MVKRTCNLAYILGIGGGVKIDKGLTIGKFFCCFLEAKDFYFALILILIFFRDTRRVLYEKLSVFLVYYSHK